MKSIAAALAASLAVAALAPAASAEDRKAVVHHEDLDLSTAAGRAELRERIDDAVNYVCRDNPTRQLSVHAQCEREAMESIVTQSNAWVRAALAPASTGRVGANTRAAPL
jgi:UrcA family protein